MEQDLKKLLTMLDRMTKFAATFMVVAVDHDMKGAVLEDERLTPFKAIGAESTKLHRELSFKYQL